MIARGLPLELLSQWMEALIQGLDESVEKGKKEKIMEKCGMTCSHYHGHIDKIRAMKKKGQNLEEILEQMNQDEMWCGEWIKKGDIIYSFCRVCECPFVVSEIIRPSSTFCQCSKGFVKSIFEAIFEKPVQVDLKKAIGQGDNVCHFVVHHKRA